MGSLDCLDCLDCLVLEVFPVSVCASQTQLVLSDNVAERKYRNKICCMESFTRRTSAATNAETESSRWQTEKLVASCDGLKVAV